MQRTGHKLTITATKGHLVATCECGKWRRAVPTTADESPLMLVGLLTGKHERHLERLGRPVADSADEMPALREDDDTDSGA